MSQPLGLCPVFLPAQSGEELLCDFVFLYLHLEGLWPGPGGLVPHIGGTHVFSTAAHLELSRSGARLKGGEC